jgi:hypothetical protein
MSFFGASAQAAPRLPPQFKGAAGAAAAAAARGAAGTSPHSSAETSAAPTPVPQAGKATRVVQIAELSHDAREAVTSILIEKAASAGGDSEGVDLWAAGASVVRRERDRYSCLVTSCGGGGVNDGPTKSGCHAAYTHVMHRDDAQSSA